MSEPRPRRLDDAARMVEVGDKPLSVREAAAEAVLTTTPEACARLVEGTPKGNPLEAARVAGLLAAKRTPELLPFCHPVALTGAELTMHVDAEGGRVHVRATVRAADRTGVEMEALTAATVAALSLYDTVKAYHRGAMITDVRLLEKRGGTGGDYRAPGRPVG